MNKISYKATNTPKQFFLVLLFANALVRLGIMIEIIVFKIDKYYEATNVPLTVIMYAIVFAAIIFFLRGYKYFLTTYDEHTVTYINKLSKKETSLKIEDIERADFNSKGIDLYAKGNSHQVALHIPFFRLGIVNAVETNNFFVMLKNTDIALEKKFKVLPGYGKSWKIVTFVYLLLAVAAFMSLAKPITLFIVLLKNH